MKIAYVYPPIWNPLADSSLGIWHRQITRRLIRYFDVLVYAAKRPPRHNQECCAGVHYRRYRTPLGTCAERLLRKFSTGRTHGRPYFASDLYHLEYALKISLDLRQQSCDIVHVYNFPQFVPIIKLFNPGIKLVLNMHGEWLTQINWRLIDKRLGNVDLILGCSDLITTQIRCRFPQFANRCHTVFMGVDPNQFCPQDRRATDTSTGRPRVLYVGRISPEKGVHVLLDAFTMIAREYPDAVLEVVGPEWTMSKEYLTFLTGDANLSHLRAFEPRNYLTRLRENIPPELKTKILFRGLVSHPDVVNYYQGADVYINPSFYESLGMSILEAMACGLAVVATRGGATIEVLPDDKAGILVEPGNVPALAEATLRLLGDESLRRSMGAAGRTRAIEIFSWERICDDLSHLYTTIVLNKN